MKRQRTFSGAPWESNVGYCRAIRVGPHVFVAGTTSQSDDGSTHAVGDPYGQARRCFEIIERALTDLGADLSHVVRTRMFVTDIDQLEDYARAHAEFFRSHPPAATMVEVSRLAEPEMLIEVEVEALVPDHPEEVSDAE